MVQKKKSKSGVINLGGKPYATFDGVLGMAHDEGLASIESECLQLPSEENGFVCVCKAKVTTKKGSFTGHGDATPKNVGKMILVHLIRMAETRAIGRALRWSVNAPTLVQELEGGDMDAPAGARRSKPLFEGSR